MSNREKVIDVFKEVVKPVSAGKITTISGLDRKVVDKVFVDLKKKDNW